MKPRRKSRERALVITYAQDISGEQATLGDLAVELEEASDDAFAESLVKASTERRAEIDGLIEESGSKWNIGRMAAIDRSILRISVGELLTQETPPNVVLNEAVELAKSYGSEHSGRFVNGVLDAIAKKLSRVTTPNI